MISIDSTNYDDCESREWLVTNGIGGFASATVASTLTRNYHGYLVAALDPPLNRKVLVSKLDETVAVGGKEYPLFMNRWKTAEDPPEPNGFDYLESFKLDNSVPMWTYRVGGFRIRKRVWMAYGENTSYVWYQSSGPASLSIKIMVNYKNFHDAMEAGSWRMEAEPVEFGLKITPLPDGIPFYLLSYHPGMKPEHEWQTDLFLPVERYRGESDVTNHLHAATFTSEIDAEGGAVLVFSTRPTPGLSGLHALGMLKQREKQVIERAGMGQEPQWIQQLVLAADQFVVRRDVDGIDNGCTILAGYHWFSDWGRDTMISLPGLTLATGRYDEAAAILRTFAKFVDQGMLPNHFPDDNEAPEYNTVDATLWYFEAIRAYHEKTGDDQLVCDLFPILQDIMNWHIKGTRYQIKMDASDGLLFAGQDDVQLTWMDIKIGDHVVTPRTGKAVEINALWYNALHIMAEFSELLNVEDKYSTNAGQVRASYAKFWNVDTGYLFDVIEGPDGNDPSLRPNQIFAVSIGRDLLTEDQQKAVVDSCLEHLVTLRGLRSLAQFEDGYVGQYGGARTVRDLAYHQGTVWAWLIGHFAQAHFRVYQNLEQKRAFLTPFQEHLKEHGVGTISEVFDGDVPHTPRGTIAQAWSVAEVLRVW